MILVQYTFNSIFQTFYLYTCKTKRNKNNEFLGEHIQTCNFLKGKLFLTRSFYPGFKVITNVKIGWRVQVYCNKRYFYLEAQSYVIDGHPELFLWLWFLGKSECSRNLVPCQILSLVWKLNKIKKSVICNNKNISTVKPVNLIALIYEEYGSYNWRTTE